MTEAPEILSKSEISQLLKAIDEPRDEAITLLFLTTGLFLQEAADLETEDIDWDKHCINVRGKRERTLALNDQAFEALAKWSKERLASAKSKAFFLTTKGKVAPLSSRSMDHLLKKYGQQALGKPLNAHTLRNTFAVRLFEENPALSLKAAKEILGIHDFDSVKRYQLQARIKDEGKDEEKGLSDTPLPTGVADTRSFLSRFIGKLFPTTPKAVQTNSHETLPALNPEDIFIGQDTVLRDIKVSLNKNQSILLTGPLGIGKTHTLKKFAKEDSCTLYFSSPSPLKPLVLELATHLTQSEISHRTSLSDLLNEVLQHEHNTLKPPTLIIDNLHKLRLSELDLFLKLAERFTLLAACDENPPKLKTLWWKLKIIELHPLNMESAQHLIEKLTQHLTIVDPEHLTNRLLTLANGNPLAIVDMVKQLNYRPVVNDDAIRELYHEAGTVYREWSWMFAVLWGVIVISRFIALGTHSFEGYILAGVGTSLFVVVRTLMARMK